MTGPSQAIANTLGSIVRHQALHLPIPEWSGLITPSPAHITRWSAGRWYIFNINHVVEPDDPCEMFPMEMVQVSNSSHAKVAP